MVEVLVAALIACTQNESVCTQTEHPDFTEVRVCDVAPNNAGSRPVQFAARVRDKNYVIVLEAKCVNL